MRSIASSGLVVELISVTPRFLQVGKDRRKLIATNARNGITLPLDRNDTNLWPHISIPSRQS